jgi:hypothetical protein
MLAPSDRDVTRPSDYGLIAGAHLFPTLNRGKYMRTNHRGVTHWAVLLVAITGWACADAPTAPTPLPNPSFEKEKFWDDLAATRWNGLATTLLQGVKASTALPENIPAPPNGQAWASRMLTYLSLAQYRAAMAASVPSNPSAAPDRPEIPRVSSAVAAASYTVLYSFFEARSELSPTLRQQILELLTSEFDERARTPGFVAAGSRIGRAVAAAVLAEAATDRYGVVPLPPRPTGAGYWVPGTGSIVRSLYGVRPLFLEDDNDALRLDRSPPAYGSGGFDQALAEVYAITSARTQGQHDIALEWNKVAPSGPFTAGEWNRAAVNYIVAYGHTELQATRVLAYANAAAFDAQIVCFTTKFKWWYPRPAQVDARIFPLLAFTTPNHPSYPSAHSCISSAFGAVLSDEFPGEKQSIEADVAEAGMSRIYAGIHYRFDIEAGHDVGKLAANAALSGSLK